MVSISTQSEAGKSSMAVCRRDGRRRRIVPAPAPSQPRLLSPMLDVECAEDEEVVWHYTVTLEGRFVSGYSIVPRVCADAREIAGAQLAAEIPRSLTELIDVSVDELFGLLGLS